MDMQPSEQNHDWMIMTVEGSPVLSGPEIRVFLVFVPLDPPQNLTAHHSSPPDVAGNYSIWSPDYYILV